MKKSNWHYVVMRSIFGDYWIGKTKLPIQKDRVYKIYQEAIDKAQNLFMSTHPDFFPSNEADTEAQYAFDEISEKNEKECDVIQKRMEKFIIN